MEPENFQVETIIFRFHVKLWEGTVNRHFCRNHLQILQNTIPFKGHSDGITVVSWQGPLSTEKLVHRTRWKSWFPCFGPPPFLSISTHKMWKGHLGGEILSKFVWWWAPGGLKKVSFRKVLEQSSYNTRNRAQDDDGSLSEPHCVQQKTCWDIKRDMLRNHLNHLPHGRHEKETLLLSLYWLFNRDPYNGLLYLATL